MARKTHAGQLREHQPPLILALTGTCAIATVFGFGFLIGRLIEPVPGMPGGIHALAWLPLPLLVGTVVLPLVSASATHRISRPPVGSERLALVPSPSASTEHGSRGVQADVDDLDAALGQFPKEQPLSSASPNTAPAEAVRVA